MKVRLNVIMFLCSLLSAPVLALGQDTVGHQTLNEVVVSSSRVPSQHLSSTPVQVVTLEKIEQTGAANVADVLNQMAGVTIKDYGGVGGIKTVSARGLGSQFSTLAIDGVAVTDCQNGQIDLGRYLVGNSSFVSLAHGQHDDIFQTARGFAAGSVINMQSISAMGNHLSASLEGGSFGYWAPTVDLQRMLGKRVALSIWANHTQSRGDYPFTIYYTQSQQDSSSLERRKNSEMSMNTLTGNLRWLMSVRSQLSLKAHFNQSHHNLPGPAVYYYIKASEHTDDQMWFLQGKYTFESLDSRLNVQAIGKTFASSCVYEDTAANGANSLLHNEYFQRETYFSATARYAITSSLTASVATDEALANLKTNLNHDNDVDRLSSQDVLALRYATRRFSTSANLLATLMKDLNRMPDSLASAKRETTYARLSPYWSGSFLLLDHADSVSVERLNLRMFFKENYRVPTFNELYYFALARDLRPEKALQCNLGLTYHLYRELPSPDEAPRGLMLDATADFYINRVADKLVAIPTQNLFLWSMVNLGQVDIKGLDLNLACRLPLTSRCSLSLDGNYSLQDARDMTDPTDKTYNQQIPYTPRHSGGMNLFFENPYVSVGYSLMAVGDRYRLGQNIESNLVPGYVDQGLSLSRELSTKYGNLRLFAQVLNIFDVQYEVVKSYPMMGRNFRLKITYSI